MKLALSGRLFEAQDGYTLDLEAFLKFARECGYDGVEIRYPQLPLETPAARIEDTAALLKTLGLEWSFGAVEGIVGDAAFERAARMLDVHRLCGCQFTRFTVSKPDEIVWAQRFADEAARRGLRVITQLHNGTLTDNVPHALDTLHRIGRPNVGLAFEPNHLRFDGNEQYAEAIQALRDCIFCISIQNFRPARPSDAKEALVRVNGRAYVRAMPDDPEGLDFPKIFASLREVGFDGFATVMADVAPGLDRCDVARRYLRTCRQFMQAAL
jgi:sugar phosphate isomerase/epimerase